MDAAGRDRAVIVLVLPVWGALRVGWGEARRTPPRLPWARPPRTPTALKVGFIRRLRTWQSFMARIGVSNRAGVCDSGRFEAAHCRFKPNLRLAFPVAR